LYRRVFAACCEAARVEKIARAWIHAVSKPKSVRIADHFAELTDPRRREVVYPLINVVVIAV
jgi:hypothetical protein